MYKLTLYAITFSAALGFACSESGGMDETAPPGPQNPSGDFHLTAAINPITRTELTDASTVIWKAGDKTQRVDRRRCLERERGADPDPRIGRTTRRPLQLAAGSVLRRLHALRRLSLCRLRQRPCCRDTDRACGGRTPQRRERGDRGVGFHAGTCLPFRGRRRAYNRIQPSLALLNIVIDGSNSIFSDGVIESFTMSGRQDLRR